MYSRQPVKVHFFSKDIAAEIFVQQNLHTTTTTKIMKTLFVCQKKLHFQ